MLDKEYQTKFMSLVNIARSVEDNEKVIEFLDTIDNKDFITAFHHEELYDPLCVCVKNSSNPLSKSIYERLVKGVEIEIIIIKSLS